MLWDKLSDALDTPQRAAKIGNLLTRMRKAGMIESTGLPKTSRWKIKVEKVNKKVKKSLNRHNPLLLKAGFILT